jgi:hypothetical protein
MTAFTVSGHGIAAARARRSWTTLRGHVPNTR